MRRDELNERCVAVWESLHQLDLRRWGRDEWREPFQLVTGAVIYMGNALAALSDEERHRLLKPQAEENVTAILASDALPDFSAPKALGGDFALMHLASASVRLPAAVWLLWKGFRNAAVRGIVGNDDVIRRQLVPHLEQVAALGCCRSDWGRADALKASIALVVAHRDEFMHGEAGEPDEEWRRRRPVAMSAAYRCRLVESQLTVVEWAVEALVYG